MLEATLPAQRYRAAARPANQGRQQSQDVARFGLPIDMYLKLVTFSGKPNQLVNVIEAILYVDILAGFLFATLIDIQDLTNMPTPAKFFHQKLRLHGPAAGGWRVIPNLKDSHCWALGSGLNSLHCFTHLDRREKRLAVC